MTGANFRVYAAASSNESPMLTFATKKLSTGANGQKEDAAFFSCPRSFDQAVIALGKLSGHVTTRSKSLQHLRSPMLTFATKWTKEDAASFLNCHSNDL